jgi:hypothetical protein
LTASEELFLGRLAITVYSFFRDTMSSGLRTWGADSILLSVERTSATYKRIAQMW